MVTSKRTSYSTCNPVSARVGISTLQSLEPIAIQPDVPVGKLRDESDQAGMTV